MNVSVDYAPEQDTEQAKADAVCVERMHRAAIRLCATWFSEDWSDILTPQLRGEISKFMIRCDELAGDFDALAEDETVQKLVKSIRKCRDNLMPNCTEHMYLSAVLALRHGGCLFDTVMQLVVAREYLLMRRSPKRPHELVELSERYWAKLMNYQIRYVCNMRPGDDFDLGHLLFG